MSVHPKLIALHGAKGAGKDLVGTYLRRLSFDAQFFAFGTRLKAICSVAFDVPMTHFVLDSLKEKPLPNGLTPREIMTRMQGPLKQEFGDDFFAAPLRAAWDNARRVGHHLIVTDLRFPVELRLCRDLDARVIHVLRPDNNLYAPSDHVSEAGLPLGACDLTILNSSTKADLWRVCQDVALRIYGEDDTNLNVPPPHPST